MTTGASRKGMLFTSAVAAAVLATSSAAFACVYFKGDMQLTVPAAPTTALGIGTGSLVTGHGSNTLHTYCPNPSLSRPGVGVSGEPLWAPDVTPTGTIAVMVAPATACVAPPGQPLNRLAGTSAKVWMFNGVSYKGNDGLGWNFVTGTGCFLQTSASHNLGTMQLNNGSGNGTFSLAGKLNQLGQPVKANVLPTEASSICVGSGSVDSDGIFAPIQVIPAALQVPPSGVQVAPGAAAHLI